MHDPTNYLTIAAYSVAKGARMDLPVNTYHVTREVTLQNQSQMAFRAATFIEFQYDLKFDRHAYAEQGEYQLKVTQGKKEKTYSLDFVDTSKNTVFEFDVCRFHPCEKYRHLFDETKDFEHAQMQASLKKDAILRAGFTFYQMKSCEFEQLDKEGYFDQPAFVEFMVKSCLLCAQETECKEGQ